MRRIGWIWKYLDEVTQRILAQTYMMSRISYAAEIIMPYIAPSTKKNIESRIRGTTRKIFHMAKSSPSKYMNQITNAIPLGVKAYTQKIKIMSKLKSYYEEEVKEFEKTMGK